MPATPPLVHQAPPRSAFQIPLLKLDIDVGSNSGSDVVKPTASKPASQTSGYGSKLAVTDSPPRKRTDKEHPPLCPAPELEAQQHAYHSMEAMKKRLGQEMASIAFLDMEEKKIDADEAYLRDQIGKLSCQHLLMDQSLLDVQQGWNELFQEQHALDMKPVETMDDEEAAVLDRVNAVRHDHKQVQSKLDLVQNQLASLGRVTKRREEVEAAMNEIEAAYENLSERKAKLISKCDAFLDVEYCRANETRRYLMQLEDDEEEETQAQVQPAPEQKRVTRSERTRNKSVTIVEEPETQQLDTSVSHSWIAGDDKSEAFIASAKKTSSVEIPMGDSTVLPFGNSEVSMTLDSHSEEVDLGDKSMVLDFGDSENMSIMVSTVTNTKRRCVDV